MKFARINLSKTDYKLLKCPAGAYGSLMMHVERHQRMDDIYRLYDEYCRHKQFDSVMPLFASQMYDSDSDIVGYYTDYTKNTIIGWSLIKRYDKENAEAVQFAWDYQNPDLRLGIESLKYECALYKAMGFKYLYLGQAADYKAALDGYELLGPV